MPDFFVVGDSAGVAVFVEVEIIGAAGGASPVYVALAVTAGDFAGASVKSQEKSGAGVRSAPLIIGIFTLQNVLLFWQRVIYGVLYKASEPAPLHHRRGRRTACVLQCVLHRA